MTLFFQYERISLKKGNHNGLTGSKWHFNYCSDDEICNEVTEFKDPKKRLKSL